MAVLRFCKFNLLSLIVYFYLPAALANSLVIAIPQDIQSFDPFFVNEVAGESITKSIFDNLLERNFAGELVPGLAESYKFTNDTSIELKLREGVKFHNDEPFNAKAVKFSVEHFLSSEITYPNAGQFSTIASVEVIDDYTVSLNLHQADASILDKLTAQLYMVPPEYYDNVGPQGFAQAPIGTGPFVFVEHQQDIQTKLKANKNYWGNGYKSNPKVEQVVFRVIPEPTTRIAEFITGNIDIITNLPPNQAVRIERVGGKVLAKESATLVMVWFSTATHEDILGDVRVRQALNYAVNTEVILEVLQKGYGKRLASTLTPFSLGFSEELTPYVYDPLKAQSLLQEANFPFDEVIELSVPPNINKIIAEAIQADLQKLGLKVSLKLMDLNAFNDAWFRFAKPEPTELFIASWGGLFDPASEAFFLHTDYGASYYSNSEVDRLLELAQSEIDFNKRAELYEQISTLVHKDPAGIYLWTPAELYAVSKRVKDWQPHPGGMVIIGKTSLLE